MRHPIKKRVLATLAANIRKIRLERGLTQEGLAELADIDRVFMQRVEAGKVNITAVTIVRIAEALGAQPGRLFDPTAPAVRRPGRPRKTPHPTT